MKNRPSTLPVLIVSGASGFIGRHVLTALCEHYYIYALARRPQKSAEVPTHENIVWIRVDITNEQAIKKTLADIAARGGADFFLHLAGFYDFRNKPDPRYRSTNVQGTKYILEACPALNLSRFIFASSLAIIDFTEKSIVIDETTPANATFPYAVSKREAESLVRQFSGVFPCTIVRLAAIYSDWCEYLPLYSLLSTWLSQRWDRRLLVGSGRTAIPYLHIHDLIYFFSCILQMTEQLDCFQILNASPRISTSQRDLFKIACHYNYFQSLNPVYIPKWFAGFGIILRNSWGFTIHKRPFERLWMIKYMDKQMIVDSTHTQILLQWKPTRRYHITRRLLFLISKMKSDPYTWHHKNRIRLREKADESQYLKIYEAMINLKESIIHEILNELASKNNAGKFSTYQKMTSAALYHCVEYIYRMLENDVRTGDRSQIMEYAHHLAEHRYLENFPAEEVMEAIKLTTNVIIRSLLTQEQLKEMKQRIYDEIIITLQMAIDEVEETYAHLSSRQNDRH